MEEFWILILVLFFASNSLDKSESVKLELKTFDEIFGEGWRDTDEAEDLKTPALTNFGQNVHHQIDRQNTQLGQIETNSTDQNPPFTESDHSDNAKNGKEQNEASSSENIAVNERKRKIINKFHAIKDEFKKKGKYSKKERTQIEVKIAKNLKVNRKKIYKWKKELGISGKTNEKEEHKHLIEKFDQRKAELTRDGFKSSYPNQINETVAKELGLSFRTIYNWKREFGQTKQNKHSHSEQKKLMKRYYEIKNKSSKINDKNIAKMLKIGTRTLYKWKRQFKPQKMHPNSIDGKSVEENAAANVQEIEDSTSGNI